MSRLQNLSLVVMVSLGLLAACDTLSSQEMNATVAAGDAIIGTEAAVINATGIVERTQVYGTVAVHQTQIAAARIMNEMLGATLDASSSPTPQLRVGVMPSPLPSQEYKIGLSSGRVAGAEDEAMDEMPQVVQTQVIQNTTDISNSGFTATGITTSVDENGCPLSVSAAFPTSISQLYFSFRPQSLPAGTAIRIVWEYNNAPVVEDSWTTPQAFDNVCLWLTITTGNVVFQAGDWAATLYVGEQAVTERMGFVIQ